MKKSILLSLLFVTVTNTIFAQRLDPNDLEGYWRQRMDINLDGALRGTGNDDPFSACLLKLTSNSSGSFNGSFEQCGYDKYITGTLYNGKLFNAVLYSSSGDKYVYCGRVTPEGTLRGNYFTPSCLYGEFEWEKVSAEAPNLKNTYVVRDGMDVQAATEANGWHLIDKKDALVINDAPPPVYPDFQPWKEAVPVFAEAPKPTESVAKYSIVTSAAKTRKPEPVPEIMAKPAQPIAVKLTKKMDICDNTSDPNAVHTPAKTHGKKVIENGKTYHIVAKGESMFCIANHYKLTIEQLGELNDKLCEHLKEGEKLLVAK
jgi:LysM repeat protein